MVGSLFLHPGGKALIEPEIVPPGHGDEVARPLMGRLVGNDLEHGLAGPLRGILRVEEETVVEVSDAAPILHRAGVEVGNRDEVELGQWIGSAEIVVVIGQYLAHYLEG